MGLYCSHGAFNGAYSAFNRFRKAVAEDACGGAWPPHKEGTICQGHTMGSDDWAWDDDTVPAELQSGMLALMEHSDCGGELSPEQCVDVAAFLRWAAPRMVGETNGHLSRAGSSMGDVALRFAAGCEKAAAAGEPLVFG